MRHIQNNQCPDSDEVTGRTKGPNVTDGTTKIKKFANPAVEKCFADAFLLLHSLQPRAGAGIELHVLVVDIRDRLQQYLCEFILINSIFNIENCFPFLVLRAMALASDSYILNPYLVC